MMTMSDEIISHEDDHVILDTFYPNKYIPLSFTHSRHETIEGISNVAQSWRMKERMKTVSVALVMCLNVGVDPPDIVKPQPCSKMECWIDPLSLQPQKALETIGNNLLKQYERWQPRARYKQSLDPTVEEVKKLCTSLRRNAKDERVLFHYNGHGVPKPTVNGEIWVFNRSYTQYIPLSVYDLMQWMSAPSIYVYDCSCAGLIVDSFNQFALQHAKEHEMNMKAAASQADNGDGNAFSPALSQSPLQSPPQYKNCIQLASCAHDQLLPMNPELPADLFTACLTTPIKIALQWFIGQNAGKLVPGINMDLLEKIPGQLTDRRTMLGELNWIFTAITDTIAWNVLPKDLFQRLFRQDLLVASLFRNFLLAERIMRSYDCTPVSSPSLPPTFHHPMWQAWDLAIDICLLQLPGILKDNVPYRNSPFFSEQLTAFQVWLNYGSRPDNHPEQLPIVLQVLLSQVHRSRALDLLGRFLDLGPWAVNLALSVGIFPYVLKLLQSSARELRPLLVFIWAKILAVDGSCQADLVRDNGHKYFLSVLSDSNMPATHRTMAAFVMACIVKNYPIGQEAALQNSMTGDLIDHCLEQLDDADCTPLLRQWLAICLGRIWENYEKARWIGARNNAHEKLYQLLDDENPEVRAAAVFSLGTFINSASERTEHVEEMARFIAQTLITKVSDDSSTLVRRELIVALQWVVLIFESYFIRIVFNQEAEFEKSKDYTKEVEQHSTLIVGTPPPIGLRKVSSRDRLSSFGISKFLNIPSTPTNINHAIGHLHVSEALTPPNNPSLVNALKRVSSSNSLSGAATSGIISHIAVANVYQNIWKSLITLSHDPYLEVATMAQDIINMITNRVKASLNESFKECISEPSLSTSTSPNTQTSYLPDSSPPNFNNNNSTTSTLQPSSRTMTPVRESYTSLSSRGTLIGSTYQHNVTQYAAATLITPFSRKRTIFGREPSISGKSDDGMLDETCQRDAIVKTQFVDWCAKYFSQPEMNNPEELDSESASYHEKEWRMHRNKMMREEAKSYLTKIDSSRLVDPHLYSHKNTNTPQLIAFHPYEPRFIVAERETFTVYNWDSNNTHHPVVLKTFSNSNASPSRITSMQLINDHDVTLLMFACDDGSLRVWRNCGLHDENISKQELVTAFHIFADMPISARNAGVVLHWNQSEQKLIASGEHNRANVIRLWDANKEMKIQDLTTGDNFVTSLSSDGGNLICAGCGDGSVRVFDDRLMPHDSRVLTFYEQKSWIINAHMFEENQKHFNIISGSISGELKWYDKRSPTSIKTMNTGISMATMSVHPEADVFACGLGNQALPNGYQSINVYTLDAILGSRVRHVEGYMSQKMNPVCSLAFHPLKAILAAGSTDNAISIYGTSHHHHM